MKSFKTVQGAFNHIKNNAQTGEENCLNRVLMFGMGIYTCSDVATYSGVKNYSASSECMYHFANDNEVICFVEWLQKN
ncbi:hypothetical protein [Xylanibacter muris]|uniref:hypothetical protein n=1 Tax=Xylanibacter muris TaxID=2736290 RepID=UPI0025959302|nr:hypothetical protein [Xylanibacter muris]